MTHLNCALPLVAALALAGCMDGRAGATATQAATPAADCSYLSGLSAAHVAQIGTIRCGPQSERPYTLANEQ